MIAMRMGDQDMGHGLAAYRVEQCLHVRRIVRPRIDDRDLTAADDVAHRALERERARIVGENTPHAGCDLLGVSGRKIKASVERDVVWHAGLFGKTRADARPRTGLGRAVKRRVLASIGKIPSAAS